MRAGFSLIELIISMAILSVGLVGAMRVFPVGLRASQRSELQSRSAILAQRTLESLKLQPWDKLVDETRTDEEGFDISVHISQPVLQRLSDPSRLKRVEVTVQPSALNRGRALTLVTYVRRQT